MRILAVETSTPFAGVAIVDEDGAVAERLLRTPMRHLELLAPTVEETLHDAGLTLQAVDGVAVSTGPGSFTGLRIGMMTAMALARVRGVSAAGVSTLEAIAAGCPWSGPICAVLDAKRGEVAAALFVRERGGLRRITEDAVAAAPEMLDRLGPHLAGGEEIAFVGDGLARDAPIITARLGPRAWLAPPIFWPPRAALVGALGLARFARGEGQAPHLLRPAYGRGGAFAPRAERAGA
ncbi:MAG: tRNA (adenosine(37)-N6)-threonylcarbamoyltransferase complex dimerization subunit type 1 TsaB [Armatimonadetes bacterium]|nr:tRNA (adenosine(37)-N6)-threonylcarbamoyltransferase complex dimerization subunit type 1 TsaB [Armatimonadota bacterium]